MYKVRRLSSSFVSMQFPLSLSFLRVNFVRFNPPIAKTSASLARARMPRDAVALLPPRPRGRIYEAARMLHASARFKAHAGEYLRGLPPQVG